ncbi:hypothetical protein CP973_16130 [Streptomyces albofaciens JCM 4342]|uniref:hypothetical protein n=1 Tax=Streptomyces albofaciens TaxID=66866 RepID=UPI0012384B33|nr:hypothetical protein [Streptomyces albofaciens]KAA6223236.1 hypothetical protein CP973_16130 [Streptomyces albofaciens JCM 4342]
MRETTDAVDALGRAAAAEKAARSRSGWYARYLWTFAAGQLVLVPLALLGRGPVAALLFTLVNAGLVTGLSVYAARQRIVRRGFGARHGLLIGSRAALYAVAVLLGTTVCADSRAFAAAAAVVCALPLAVGAWFEMRRSS